MTGEKKLLNILVFAGQGSDFIDCQDARDQLALYSSTSPLGALLLSECHSAFHHELSSLSASEREQAKISKNDFISKGTLIELPHTLYLQNPVVTMTSLFLFQSLRYLTFLEALTCDGESPGEIGNFLRFIENTGVGISGFSSGAITACIAAASPSTSAFISQAVQGFRLSFWIGFRAQLYRLETLEAASQDSTDPWSVVILGISPTDTESRILDFNQTPGGELYVTAIIDENCVTISGRPDVLASFSRISTKCTIRPTLVNSLYHVPMHATGILSQVLEDTTRRHIVFPSFVDLIAPLRSSHSGELISLQCAERSLLQQVLEMVLVQPVHWDLVVRGTAAAMPENTPVRIVNVGPGYALARQFKRTFKHQDVGYFDFSARYSLPFQGAKIERVAIIGMAVKMPGAPNADALWRLLKDGGSTVSEVPASRFQVSDYNENKFSGRAMRAHTGNFIDDVDVFDHKFFKISPREAADMDPQQRLLLHVAYHALEDSGYVPHATPTFNPDTFGCFIGAATNDYVHNLRDNVDLYYTTGTLPAFLSGRVSYAMSMSGPSMVIDTACSSSSVALHHAVRALQIGDCNAALVGGVNVITSPDMFIGLDNGHFLTHAGQCRPFDVDADGYSRGEGCGVFVLKRLSDALDENDRISGIIRGIGMNQSGKASSITRPHVPTQCALLRTLLDKAGISAKEINLVEAHAAGTQVGDTNEMESVRSVVGAGRPSHNPLYVTSIKASIGHLEAASGSASLAKVLLMLQHNIIPRQTSLRTINPHIPFRSSDHIIIANENVDWKPVTVGHPRYAVINNYGAAGSNVAILIEEHLDSRDSSVRTDPTQEFVFGMSAGDPGVLELLRDDYLDWLDCSENSGISILDVAYTSTARRQLHDFRLCISGSDRRDIIQKLRCAPIVPVSSTDIKVVFVFSGQGSHYPRMGLSLYKTSPTFKRHIDECNSVLIDSGFPGFVPYITGGTDDHLNPAESSLTRQVALFALEYALAQLWISIGVTPAALFGHSIGEYAALVVANVLSLKDAICIIATRANLMTQYCAPHTTGMLAVSLEYDVLQRLLDSEFSSSGLSISCYNSPRSCTVSGPLSQLEDLESRLKVLDHCQATMLDVLFGYHSPAMEPLLEEFLTFTSAIKFSKPTIPVISSVTGQVVLPEDDPVFDASYLTSHCINPVKFDQAIQSFLSKGPLLGAKICWLEVGPRPVLLPLLKGHSLISQDGLFLASLNRHTGGWQAISSSLSQLYLIKMKINWRELFSRMGDAKPISLPSYPFRTPSFWVPYRDPSMPSPVPSKSNDSKSYLKYTLLKSWTQVPHDDNGWVATFETPLSNMGEFIRGHQVGGAMLCPASLYIEAAVSGLALVEESRQKYAPASRYIHNIEFLKPLVLADQNEQSMFVVKLSLVDGHDAFVISTQSGAENAGTTHAQGIFRSHSFNEVTGKFSRKLPLIQARISALRTLPNADVFSSSTIYNIIFPRVVKYSPEYHSLEHMIISPSRTDASGVMKLPTDTFNGKFIVHLAFLDAMVHAAGLLANLQGDLQNCFVCAGIGSMKFIPNAFQSDYSYALYCTIIPGSDRHMMLAQTYVIKLGSSSTMVAYLKDIRFREVPINIFQGSLPVSIASTPRTLNRDQAIRTWRDESAPNADFSAQEIATQVAELVFEISHAPIEELFLDTDLKSLGVDSLMMTDISKQLQVLYPSSNIDCHLLSKSKNLSEIVSQISDVSIPIPGKTLSLSSSGTLVGGISPKSSRNAIRQAPDLRHILCESLNYQRDDLPDDAELQSLGLDSLTSIEVIHVLKSQYRLDLPINFFEKYTTLTTAQLRLEELQPKKHQTQRTSASRSLGLQLQAIKDTANSFVYRLQTSSSGKAALWLVHDGSGLVHQYETIHGLGRNVMAIGNPRFSSGLAWDSIVDMASAYAQTLRSITTETVILAGWSFGGVVAFEIAKQLAVQGAGVKGVVMIDSPSPLDGVRLSEALVDCILDFERNSNLEVQGLVKKQFLAASNLLAGYSHQQTNGSNPQLVFLRCVDGYVPPASNLNDLGIHPWLTDRNEPPSTSAGWGNITGSTVKVLDIPGHHFEPFKAAHVAQVSRALSEACEHLENSDYRSACVLSTSVGKV